MMEIIRQMKDDELKDLALASDEQFLREQLAELPASVKAAADRPEAFWQKQRQAIWRRIETKKSRRLIPRLAWAAVAVAVLAGVLIGHPSRPVSPVVIVTPPQAQVDDNELLAGIERTLQSDGPEALQPVSLLTQETSQDSSSTNSASPVSTKEKDHEN